MPEGLTRDEQKAVKEAIKKARKNDGTPRTAQQSIPFDRMFPDGICRVGLDYYTKTIQFQDTKFYNLMMMYRCAIREIQTKLEVLDDEFSVENNRNPISFIKTRIKKPNSIYDKLQKMGYEFTTENIQTYLNDVAGVRIVCAFIDDIYMISDLITQQDDIKVIEIKDYIKNPKSNGYRSYHMIVEIPVFFAKGKTPMRVELLHSARAIIEADNEMQRIKDKIGMFHEI